jgi:hypothetical protein
MLTPYICRSSKPALLALTAPALLIVLLVTTSAVGQSHSGSQSLSNIVNVMLQATLPREYDGEKNWGRTKEVTVGVRLRREGLRLETKRRRKAVNDGLWTKYQVRVPDGRKLDLDVADVRHINRGEFAFVLVATAPLVGHADVMHWNRGIRLLSVGVDCEATVRLRLEGTVGLNVDGGIVTPAVAVEPRIITAKLELVDFRLTRLGEVDRHIAHEIGEALEGPLRDRLAKEEAKVVQRLNRSIAKHRDDLRVSGDEFLKEQWERIKRKWYEPSAPTASGGSSVVPTPRP